MRKFECGVCGYVYEPGKGVPELGIPPGTSFEALPADFCCPVCGADKDSFSPLAAEDGDVSSKPVTLQTTIEQVTPRTPTIKSFRLAAPGRAGFRPGQYLSIRLENDKELTRYLSISSSPTDEGYLEVTKRITQSRFSQILDCVEPGYPVSIKYPMGTFTFEGEFDKIILLSGGIGITPLRSISRYIASKGLKTNVCLLYGNRDLAEVAFKSEFDEIERVNPRFKVVHCLAAAGDEWTGRRGNISATVIKEEVPDYLECPFYLCGPPGMVAALTRTLREELQVPEEQIRTEGFAGY